MFRFFENLVDPYVACPQTDTPPRRLWLFLRDYARPFRGIFILTAIASLIVATMEIGLIWYMSRIVEAGRHEALLARGGLYARFRARQSGGFLGIDESFPDEGRIATEAAAV